MMKNNFFVIDTNALISAALLPNSISKIVFDKAIIIGTLASSNPTFEEFIEVLLRKKFDRYLTDDERRAFIDRVKRNTKFFIPQLTITDCRDPKDNKFLELAVSANASCLITGDKDLLVLNPFRGIPVLNPVDFVDVF